MAAYFPLFVNIEHKSFCVFGAGHIAARRIQGLLRFGAVVTVIAPRVLEEIENMQSAYAGQLYIEYRSYRMGEIQIMCLPQRMMRQSTARFTGNAAIRRFRLTMRLTAGSVIFIFRL